MKPSRIFYLGFNLLLALALLAGCAQAMLPVAMVNSAGSTAPTRAPANRLFIPFIIRPSQDSSPPATPGPAATPAPDKIPSATYNFRKGPVLLYTGDQTQMKVVWQLDSSQVSTLQWGKDTSFSFGQASVTEQGSDHLFASAMTGLTPATRYVYRISAGSQVSVGSFVTAPDPAATDLSFLAYGDTRTQINFHDAVAGRIVQTYSSYPSYQTLAVIVGDLTSSGDQESSWQSQFFDPQYKNIRSLLANLTFLPVMGNHEQSGNLFKKYFPLPFVSSRYWSFDYGPAHFVMLDQYTDYSAGSSQYRWLESDLSASQKTWKFIVLHEPGWSAGGDHPNNTTVQNDLQPLAEKYGVSIFFGGHNHYYARAVVNGVQHLTVGIGGAPIDDPDPSMPDVVATAKKYGFLKVSIHGNTLTAAAVDKDGNVIDTFTLNR